MKATCDIVIELGDPSGIDAILKSVSVDDFDFVSSKRDGTKILASIKSNSVSSLLHTLDDYLACVSVAMKVVDKN
jgi:hypothetical protein